MDAQQEFDFYSLAENQEPKGAPHRIRHAREVIERGLSAPTEELHPRARDDRLTELNWQPHGYEGFQAQGVRGLWLIFVQGDKYTVWFQPNHTRGMLCVQNFTDAESAKAHCLSKERVGA